MKKGIHPKYYDDCQVTCSCGNSFVTGSTKKKLEVEICSACHPFYTGQSKYIDTEGRIDRFERKRKAAATAKNKKSKAKKKKPKKIPKKNQKKKLKKKAK